MKREFLKIAFLATAMAGVFAACEKEDNNPGDGKGSDKRLISFSVSEAKTKKPTMPMITGRSTG